MHLKKTCFLRKCGEDVALYNPTFDSSIILRDADAFLEPLKGTSICDVATRLACGNNDLSNTIQYDIENFYRDLAALKLVEICDDGFCRTAEENDTVDQICTRATGDPILNFYHEHDLPIELHVDLTDACTEKCVHCYIPHERCHYLPYNIVEKILGEFRRAQGMTVYLSGGECMMHPDFDRICSLCHEVDLNFAILSNLTLLDNKKTDVLKKCKPQFVNVSLYSMDAGEHDSITNVPGSWRTTMDAIHLCRENEIAVRIATPLLKNNKNAYSGLIHFANKINARLVPDCDIYPRCNGDCENLNWCCSTEEIESVLRENKGAWKCCPTSDTTSESRVCIVGERIFVNAKGCYYPCSTLNDWSLGDARDTTLTEVWQGEKMKYLRGLKNKDFPQCIGCEHRAFCKVCPAFNFNATGSLFKTISAKCAVSAVKHKVFGGE